MNIEEMKKKLATEKLKGMSGMSAMSLYPLMKQGPVLIIDPKGNRKDFKE
ncbi:hypothetical protein ACQCPQ_31355 (plasmid) [Priestia megaterium]